jgi:hypothetical protein
MDAAERDPELAKLHAQLHVEMTTGFRTIIERAQQRGEVPDNRGVTEIVALVVGPLFYRRWLSREPIDEGFVNRVIENAIRDHQVTARPGRSQSGTGTTNDTNNLTQRRKGSRKRQSLKQEASSER